MLWMILFLVVHVVEVFVSGAVNEIRSMITGKYVVPKEDVE
jgi:thiosulfate reductase cytochrome b subunit